MSILDIFMSIGIGVCFFLICWENKQLNKRLDDHFEFEKSVVDVLDKVVTAVEKHTDELDALNLQRKGMTQDKE